MDASREIRRLAVPLILSNLTVPLLGMVDTAVVGHLPEPHHLGAVAIGALTLSVVYFLLGFLRMGTTGLAAQAFGAGDGAELRALLARALLLALVLALVLIALRPLIVQLSIALYGPSERVAAGFSTYVAIRILGAPAALGNLVLLGWLLGLQNARGPLYLLLATNGINIVLDLVFVLGLGWGVAGVAAASVVADAAGLALGLWLAGRELRALGGAWDLARVTAAAPLARLITVNRDIFLRSLCLEAAFVTFAALGARQGEVVLAATAVLLNFQLLAAYGLDGFAYATEAMVGRQIGRRDRPAFRAATRAGLVHALWLALIMALGLAALGPAGIRVMTGLEQVREAAYGFLPYMVASPVVSVWAFLLDGVFIGATRTAEMRNGMLASLALFLGACALLVPPLANHGLWLAFLAFMAARGVWLGVVYVLIERRAGFVARGERYVRP
jgi:multidrug resistance protein, MATE family